MAAAMAGGGGSVAGRWRVARRWRSATLRGPTRCRWSSAAPEASESSGALGSLGRSSRRPVLRAAASLRQSIGHECCACHLAPNAFIEGFSRGGVIRSERAQITPRSRRRRQTTPPQGESLHYPPSLHVAGHCHSRLRIALDAVQFHALPHGRDSGSVALYRFHRGSFEFVPRNR